MINSICHEAPLGKSDHEVLHINLNIAKSHFKELNSEPKYNFYKINQIDFKNYLTSIDWTKLSNMNLEDAWTFFKNSLHSGFDKFVPLSNQKSKKSKPFWLDRKCMKYIRKKYTLYKRYKYSNLHYDYQNYIKARNEAKRQIKKAVREHEKKIACESKTNPKSFWKYVNTKLKRTTGINNLMKPDGTLTDSDSEKANILNNFFSSVFTSENMDNIPDLDPHNNNQFICDIVLTRLAVEKKLYSLNPNKAIGPDKIPALILKEYSVELSVPLAIIFNKSLEEGNIPSDWKKADVTAIFKKGDKSNPGNYRPVSLTCILCKVLESFIKDQIQTFMEQNNLFSDCQHGFRQHRSCVTQLLEVLNDITNFIENSDNVDIIYMDFSKAFDSVPHQRLLIKLKAYGINDKLLTWISGFLENRCQRVKVNGSYSDYNPVVSGIPQGSILGPLLFIIFINDLPECVNSLCKIFADDTKIYSSSDNQKLLQDDLLALLDWSRKWQLKFNIDKCSILHIGKDDSNRYYMDESHNNELKQTTKEKDVGVTFDTNLKFDTHISTIVKKANQLAGLVRRSFTFLDKFTFLKLYKSIVRPHLEYANVIWHPGLKRQQVVIEKVQRRATKSIAELKDLSYSERLVSLDLPSIKYRQIRADLIQTYKILHGIDNINKDNLFTLSNCNNTRNSSFKLYKEFASSSSRCNFLTIRVNSLWNSLSVNTRQAADILKFKIGVDLDLKNIRYDFYD